MQKRLASYSRSRFCITPVKLANYINNTWEPTQALKQPWVIIKLLDEKHVQFTLHLVNRVHPDKRIKENTRYSIFHKHLWQAWQKQKIIIRNETIFRKLLIYVNTKEWSSKQTKRNTCHLNRWKKSSSYIPQFATTLNMCFKAESVSKLSCTGGTDCNKNPRIENPERRCIWCWFAEFSSKTEAISSMTSAVRRSFVIGVSNVCSNFPLSTFSYLSDWEKRGKNTETPPTQ